MTKTYSKKLSLFIKSLAVSTTSLFVMVFTSVSAFAAEGGSTAEQTGIDVTQTVEDAPVKFEWFYWLGWAFVAAVIMLAGAVLFGWYKSVLAPKYRGKKVSQ
jgi:hypothetical protein